MTDVFIIKLLCFFVCVFFGGGLIGKQLKWLSKGANKLNLKVYISFKYIQDDVYIIRSLKEMIFFFFKNMNPKNLNSANFRTANCKHTVSTFGLSSRQTLANERLFYLNKSIVFMFQK